MTPLEKLEALSRNLWWSWHPEALDLFRRLNPEAFRTANNNPIVALRSANPALLQEKAFLKEVDTVYDAFQTYLHAPSRYADAATTAYFCMEFGLHESFPLYSGGLGILAGDHVKATSDLGYPFTAIGLFLRDGYFKQYFDVKGWQEAEFPSIDATLQPVTLVTGVDGKALTVAVPIEHTTLHLRAWRVAVGRTPLYLLDADFDANPYNLRFLTRRLYQGDRKTRIQQEIILGIGGVRMLRTLGLRPDVFHMNEGHCAFLTLELLRERLVVGDPRPVAETTVYNQCTFTTHTPVMAGHDRFDPALFLAEMHGFRTQLGLSEHDLMGYGRVNPNDMTEPFTMTVLGLKLSRKANGVSKLNGEVARRQWHHLYPHLPLDRVPIGHVTNGIHLATWTSPAARPFLRQHLGDWEKHLEDPKTWARIDRIPDKALWDYRRLLRGALIDFVNDYTAHQSLRQTPALDKEALTIGFARRFATYKRAPLLFHDLERTLALFQDADRPLQVIYAGKAHPADNPGKAYIQEIYTLTQHPKLRGKVVFLEDYDMEIGRMLVSGCDVWLNNPRRPFEASGTSGQKTALHGCLNLSILDGWWPEGYNGHNGWAIGHEDSHEYKDPTIQDPEDAAFLYQILTEQVLPAFYERDDRGLPTQWIARMRQAMHHLPYAFSARRMVKDYAERYYQHIEAEALTSS